MGSPQQRISPPRESRSRQIRNSKTQENQDLPTAFLQNRILAHVKSQRRINRFRILHGRLLRKSGRKISRKPVAAGVSGRFLSLNIPIRRTNAGDEIGLITTLYWRFFGSADAGTIATPTAAATKSKSVPNCSTTVVCLRLKPFAAAIASIWRRNPALVGSETNSSFSRSLNAREGLLRNLCVDGRTAKHDSCT